MATIVPIYSQQQQQPQQQQQTSQSNDPLFDALVKYITSGPGVESTTTSQIQDIYNSYAAADGGRAYLEELMGGPASRVTQLFDRDSEVQGFISTNMNSLTLHFTAPQAYVRFEGTARGFFGMQVLTFDKRTKFLWKGDIPTDGPVSFNVTMPDFGLMIIEFRGKTAEPFAELMVPGAQFRIPPSGVPGEGSFEQIFLAQ